MRDEGAAEEAATRRRPLVSLRSANPSLPGQRSRTASWPQHGRSATKRDPGWSLPPPGRLRPARLRVRAAPCRAPPGRRVHQPGQPQGLLPLAPPRGAAPDGLAADRPAGRDQRGPQPGREDHPQPWPATPARVTSTAGKVRRARPPTTAPVSRPVVTGRPVYQRRRPPLRVGREHARPGRELPGRRPHQAAADQPQPACERDGGS